MSTQTKLKRFSLANLTQKFNNINNNIDNNNNNNNTNTNTNKKRQERTQSLYIKPTKISEDELPKKSHTQHIKKTIRRSLSVIMYATPLPSPPTSASASPKESQNHLVPVLVTSKVVDEDPSMLLSPPPLPPSSTISPSTTTTTTTNTPLSSSKKPCLEYDNTMVIELLSPKKKEDVEDEKKDDDLLLLWQGYGFIMPSKITSDNDINNNNTLVLDEASLMASFEKDIWSTYKGLIHPVHLIDLNENDRWKHLSVMELKRYYDNYGSMMLKQREWRKEQQCLHYIPTFKQQV